VTFAFYGILLETSVLEKLLGKKKYKGMETKVSDMDFAGDISGDGVIALRLETGKVLKQFPAIQNAYFSKLNYRGEDITRVCLIIEYSNPTSGIASEIVNKCSGIASVDIIFSDSLPADLFQDIKLDSETLLDDSNLLFECPLFVTRGTNTEMPAEWKGAILHYYVSAKNHESALIKAADDLKSDGYKFEGVYEGKVSQLDPAIWWDQYVMEKWSEFAEHFPSQEDMEVILATGDLHKGPALGWENDASDT